MLYCSFVSKNNNLRAACNFVNKMIFGIDNDQVKQYIYLRHLSWSCTQNTHNYRGRPVNDNSSFSQQKDEADGWLVFSSHFSC